MIRLALFLLFALLAPDLSWAQTQTSCPGVGGRLKSLNHETLTISTTAPVSLTQSKFANAVMAVISIQNQPVRYWDDGTAPTATVGTFVNGTATAPGVLTVCERQLATIQFILDNTQTGNATASVNYYGY